jgi:hypothetical protein
MAYGQKNYNEIQGIAGKYRINQIGCFITAFANLLDRFGHGVGSPIEVNRILRDGNFYLDVDDGVRDDVGYSTVSKINGNIVVARTGKGLPPSNNCIVKFTGLSGFGTHFCLVVDAAKGLILDSWDGVVKHWSTYNNPDEWAEYVDHTPAPAPQPTSAPAASVPAPNYDGNAITIQAGWGLSHAAQAAGFGDWQSDARWAEIARLNGSDNWQAFNAGLKKGQRIVVGNSHPAPAPEPQKPVEAPQAPEIVNITVQAGWGITHVLKAAGYAKEQYENEAEWDRVAQLNGSATRLRLQPNQTVKVYKQPLPAAQPVAAAAPAPTPAPVVEAPQAVAPVVDPPKQAEEAKENEDGSVSVPVTVVPTDPKAYQKTFVPEDKVYIAKESMIIKDFDQLHMDRQLIQNQKVISGGTFEKDGETYVRTKKQVEEGAWYDLNKKSLDAGQDPDAYVGPLTADDDDLDLKNLLDPDFIAEAKDELKTWTSRQKFIDLLGRIYDVLSKVKFWNKNKTA